ncbi:MAG: AraC family transcriptional regulator [Myxococcales bacterium]|nr:AraC family transcriptional regulator [Myxococcales bacterium]
MASAVAALSVLECGGDGPLVAIPRPEAHIVARFGSSASGVDVHALGARDQAHRKHIRRGQRAVTARLRLGAHEAVLGVPAPEIAGRIVALGDLWGEAAARRLRERLAASRSTAEAVAILDAAICERVALSAARREPAQLGLVAADRLSTASVNAVAVELGVSERHLRRVFREAVGMSPKTFARLSRFHRALRAARREAHPRWASIAALAGYYDQAHLIAEFRAITGVTPRVLLRELQASAVS